jgi:hypothetical protein
MSSLLELAKAVAASEKATAQTATLALTHFVDKAWAYYAGSAGGSVSAISFPESLPRKRGTEFGTCSKLSAAAVSGFKDAQKFSMNDSFDKAKLKDAVQNIVKYTTAPLIQVCMHDAPDDPGTHA